MAERSEEKGQKEALLIFYDSEAANGNISYGDVIEIAAKCHPDIVQGTFHSLINTKQSLGSFAINKCGITADQLEGKAYLPGVMAKFLDWIDIMLVRAQTLHDKSFYPVLCAHGGYQFDFLILFANLERTGVPRETLIDRNLHFADTFHFCTELQDKGESLLEGVKLSMDGLFSKFCPKDVYKDRHRAMGDVNAMVKIFTGPKLKKLLHKIHISTVQERIQYFVLQSHQKQQQVILDGKLSSLDACSRNMSSKRLLKEGITYDVLQTIFQECTSYMDFWQYLKSIGIERKVARVFTSQFGAMGLHNHGALAYRSPDGSVSGSSSDDSKSNGYPARGKAESESIPSKPLVTRGEHSQGKITVKSSNSGATHARATSSCQAFEQRPSDYAVTSTSRVSENFHPSSEVVDQHNTESDSGSQSKGVRSKGNSGSNQRSNGGTETAEGNSEIIKDSKASVCVAPPASSSETDGTSEDWDSDIKSSKDRGQFAITFKDTIPVSVCVDDMTSPYLEKKPAKKQGKLAGKGTSDSRAKPNQQNNGKRSYAKTLQVGTSDNNNKVPGHGVSSNATQSRVVDKSQEGQKSGAGKGRGSRNQRKWDNYTDLNDKSDIVTSNTMPQSDSTKHSDTLDDNSSRQMNSNVKEDANDEPSELRDKSGSSKKNKKTRKQEDESAPCIFPKEMVSGASESEEKQGQVVSGSTDSALRLRTVYVGDVAIFVPMEKGDGMCDVDLREDRTDEECLPESDGKQTEELEKKDEVSSSAEEQIQEANGAPEIDMSEPSNNSERMLETSNSEGTDPGEQISSSDGNMKEDDTQPGQPCVDQASLYQPSMMECQDQTQESGLMPGEMPPPSVDSVLSNGGISEMEWDGYGSWVNTESESMEGSFIAHHPQPHFQVPQYPYPTLPVPYGYPPVPTMIPLLPHHPYPHMAFAPPQGFLPYRPLHPGYGLPMPYLPAPMYQTLPEPMPYQQIQTPVLFNQAAQEPQQVDSPDVLGIPNSGPANSLPLPVSTVTMMSDTTGTTSGSNSERSSPFLHNESTELRQKKDEIAYEVKSKRKNGRSKESAARGDRSHGNQQRKRSSKTEKSLRGREVRSERSPRDGAGKKSETRSASPPRDKDSPKGNASPPRSSQSKTRKTQDSTSSLTPDSEPCPEVPSVKSVPSPGSSSPKRKIQNSKKDSSPQGSHTGKQPLSPKEKRLSSSSDRSSELSRGRDGASSRGAVEVREVPRRLTGSFERKPRPASPQRSMRGRQDSGGSPKNENKATEAQDSTSTERVVKTTSPNGDNTGKETARKTTPSPLQKSHSSRGKDNVSGKLANGKDHPEAQSIEEKPRNGNGNGSQSVEPPKPQREQRSRKTRDPISSRAESSRSTRAEEVPSQSKARNDKSDRSKPSSKSNENVDSSSKQPGKPLETNKTGLTPPPVSYGVAENREVNHSTSEKSKDTHTQRKWKNSQKTSPPNINPKIERSSTEEAENSCKEKLLLPNGSIPAGAQNGIGPDSDRKQSENSRNYSSKKSGSYSAALKSRSTNTRQSNDNNNNASSSRARDHRFTNKR